MSVFETRFRDHGVFAQLAAVERGLPDASALTDAEQVEHVERLRNVISYVAAALDRCDPQLVSLIILDSMASSIDEIRQEIDLFAEDPDTAYLRTANDHVETLLDAAGRLPMIQSRVEVKRLQEAIDSFRTSASARLREVESAAESAESQLAAVHGKVDEVEDRITQQDARLDAVVTDFQAQFSQSQDARQTEFAQLVSQTTSEVTRLTTETTAEVSRLTTEATDVFVTARKEHEETIAASIAKTEKAVTSLRDREKARGDAVIAELNTLLEKATTTVGVIGNTGLTGGYKKSADAEANAAFWLRLLAIVALVAAVAFSAWFTWKYHNDLSWRRIASKSFVSVPLLILFGYAARESSQHRHAAELRRSIELQLASIDSYLVELPQGTRDDVKARLAHRFFGTPVQGVATAPVRDEDVS